MIAPNGEKEEEMYPIKGAFNTKEEVKDFSEEWSNLVEGYQLLNHLSQREAKSRAWRFVLMEREENLRTDMEREYQERGDGGYER